MLTKTTKRGAGLDTKKFSGEAKVLHRRPIDFDALLKKLEKLPPLTPTTENIDED